MFVEERIPVPITSTFVRFQNDVLELKKDPSQFFFNIQKKIVQYNDIGREPILVWVIIEKK